ncbi:L,D-transpeptidase family protein [Sphingomonas ginkgonis]|uniref:L,D-transpeptidase family protein n=1 Tax=Sphingomonas ginkgonis TaxID=2315330 RepID=UPI0016396613|nr:L,D-transpeptidase family protein [Sphingomonas ginkgonis]
MNSIRLSLGIGAAVLALASPAEARRRPLPAPAAPVVTYAPRPTDAPLWFWNKKVDPAVGVLATVLVNAPAEGIVDGAQRAAEVNRAAALALSGKPDDTAAANRIVSSAWAAYVQAIKAPTPGMIYAYASLKPQNTERATILRSAAAASDLSRHLEQVAALNPIYSALRAEAIKRYKANGGFADEALIENLARARSLPPGGRYILVNTAQQRLWMFEDGKPVGSMRVVVGMPDLATPLIASYVHYATLNPYWNVPDHLVKKTVAANTVKTGLKYLTAHGYQVMSDWTDKAEVVPAASVDWKAVADGGKMVRVRELPGGANSMGKMKFTFPNGQGIFMHDTPEKELLDKDVRTFSNGCIRLEDAPRLGEWLLGRPPVAEGSDPEQLVKLPQGVPVFVTYLTTMPVDGRLVTVSDVYGWDRSPSKQIAAAEFLPTGARD